MVNKRSAVFCGHANENPNSGCPCDEECYCRQPGRTCYNKPKDAVVECAPLVQKNSNDIEKRLTRLEEKVSNLVEAIHEISKSNRRYGR